MILSMITLVSSPRLIVTISTLGTIISLIVVLPSLIALLAIDSASLSIIFKSTASFKKSVISETDWVFIKKGFLKYFFILVKIPDGGWLSSFSDFLFISQLYGFLICNFSNMFISLDSIMFAMASSS